ncbi:hypothetical protein, partial [Sinorhizobium meliloti]|uniref:hypothetical protein n=1 Tax=Rhizobium meliloti TaxID=382 RepID=UPI001AED11B5
VVVGVGEGGVAGAPTGYGKIKGRTSRLSRLVVLIGFLSRFRTSFALTEMCAPLNCQALSTHVAHRAGLDDEWR